MKKSELRKLIKEEIQKLSEGIEDDAFRDKKEIRLLLSAFRDFLGSTTMSSQQKNFGEYIYKQLRAYAAFKEKYITYEKLNNLYKDQRAWNAKNSPIKNFFIVMFKD